MIPLLRIYLSILFFTILPVVLAQTQTVADPNSPGNSIVEVITQGVNGLPVTQILQSITANGNQGPGGGAATTTTPPLQATAPTTTATTANTATTATTAAVVTLGPGPVAQPAPTVPVGEGTTSYQYTTVDALGETTVIHDIFTPTYNPLPSTGPPGVGTVLPLSQWTALVGTNTAGSATSTAASWRISRNDVRIMIVMVGIIAGVFAVF